MKTCVTLIGCALSCSCAVGPIYREPVTVVAETFNHASNQPPEFPAAGWWTLFGSSELDRHVLRALAENPTLTLAAARLDEARALLGSARSDKQPTLGLDATVGRARTSQTTANPLPQSEATVHRLQFISSYELDLWGRVRHSDAAALAQLEASADALDVARLAVAAETAVTYFACESAGREIDVLSNTVALRKVSLQLASRRAEVGTIGDLDVVRARADLAATEAELLEARRRGEAALHALAVLENRLPTGPVKELHDDSIGIPAIPPGLPSALLFRRPDIAQLERILAAASERIGVARAAFFPTIRLTATAGGASEDLTRLLDRPSLIWGILPAIALPVFDGHRNRSNLDAANARYAQALASYRSGVLTAFRETEDGLSNVSYTGERADALERGALASTQAAGVSRSRYDHGLVSYFEVVESERAALAAQRAVIQSREQRLVATVALVKALGGGWNASTSGSDASVPVREDER
jgi:multidrug efflux system outer membrane protein